MFEGFKNKIIVIEGADGTGKDTICDLLQIKLKNSVVVRFPNRNNQSGQIINAVLKKHMLMEPLSFQALQVINKIETLYEISKLPDADYYIFCRYYPSAYIYGLNDGIDINYSVMINSTLPRSWLTILLHGKNYGKHEEYYEQDDVQSKISQTYLDLAKTYGWTKIKNCYKPESIVLMILEVIKMREKEAQYDT